MSLPKKNLPFKIVNFTEDCLENDQKSIDCVPSRWLSLDSTTCQIITKFMPPPYTAKKCRILHQLVKSQKNAPEDWPEYTVTVLTGAASYSEALVKVDKFKDEDYVYTTDCNNNTDDDENTKFNNENQQKKQGLPSVLGLTGKKTKPRTYSTDSDSSTDKQEDSSENTPSVQKHALLESKQHKPQKIGNDSQEASVSSRPYGEQQHISEEKIAKNAPLPAMATETLTKYFRRILSDLQVIIHDQKLLRNDVEILKDKIERYHSEMRGENGKPSVHWTTENAINWPLHTKEQYDHLNSLLAHDNIRKDFVAMIGFVIDSTTVISKNMLAVIRKFLHKDLATKFTCVKRVNHKFTMKPSLFYECIIEAFTSKSRQGAIRETISEKSLDKLIGIILTNSKDWDEGRVHTREILLEMEKTIQEDSAE